MKILWILLLIVLLVSTITIPIVYEKYFKNETNENFFFGISFGGNTTSQAKSLIDKVKDYTNLIIINSYDVTINETMLNEISQYAVDANMHFMVFFDFVSQVAYPWHQTWLDGVEERFGDKFLGVYLYDEPGGRQIEGGYFKEKDKDNPSNFHETILDYSEAAAKFVTDIGSIQSTHDVKRRNLKMYTSDFALYWFDYLAGYDGVFVELGWNHSRTKHIALGRGAANLQNKEWGAIITWTFNKPPYIGNGIEIFDDMITAYRGGAKYIIIFNYPHNQEFGILNEEHFTAMETFWKMTRKPKHESLEKIDAEIAYVLPKDYGWGMRHPDDKIWFPQWGPDELSPEIWSDLNKLIDDYGLELDIIYDDSNFSYEEKYSKIYHWDN